MFDRLPPCCAEIDEPPCPQHEQAAKVIPHQGPHNRHAGGRSFVGESGKAKPARGEDQP